MGETKDEKTGNTALHIAAQNGHGELVRFLVDKKANLNCQNGKGQTPLHMTIKYDLYFLSKYLLDKGADPTIKNIDGHEALVGIDGDKVEAEAYDTPFLIFKGASDDKVELEIAFS